MTDQSEEPSLSRKVTDIALIVIAAAAVAGWLWRRIRRPAMIDRIAPEATPIDDKVGAAVGFPGDSNLP